MKRKTQFISVFLIIFIMLSFFSGCSGKSSDVSNTSAAEVKKRESALQVLLPQSEGTVTYGNEIVSIDASNTSEGYVMVQYNGGAEKVKLQITIPDGTVYTYTLSSGTYETFPLTGGNGPYHLDVLENVRDDLYALSFAQDMDVAVHDEFRSFLYPNQYVWFTETSKAVALGKNLSDKSTDDLNYVQNVYYYVIENISYDYEIAENTPTDYLPNLDKTLEKKKGICFDYASLMAAMLRSQSIPTKLEVGYSGTAYHAWVSVYLKEKGWIDKIIEFDGENWSLMDPTLAANNSKKSVGKYIGDGNNYIVKYSY
ncbi:transglutaminase-like domain-containing protein [Faecalicatena contorta]|uniref:Transglutaminase-like superfamily protein n=1 Tax=Faecalicatena contorta TaxID=39482 RepID=A0A315ZQ57_9FIRM|nr:transglutaminase-like domain-containing protein [Faecalicatena contorta]PWJ47233.1 transglutaminase superfamily protein [Faecalicatena contorta]SUQ16076.1 Transglutaminase-like superfamily protein [Faecalicatena contorta]